MSNSAEKQFLADRSWQVKTAEFMESGHMACPGCGASLSMRHALKVLGEQTIVVIPACCWAIIAGGQPTTALSLPLLHTPFAVAAAAASGLRRALIAQDKDVQVLVWAGDGGTFDIGLQGISGAAERQEDMIYVCYDNEAYMNTGIQRSSATPHGAWTTTTPAGKEFAYGKKDILGIIKAHQPAYMASATIAYPDDFYAKFARAKAARGFRFLHVLAACPSGWKIDSQDSLKVTRMAVQSGVFPLLETDAGGELRQTVIPEKKIPVNDYLMAQGRFKKMPADEIAAWQQEIDGKRGTEN